MDDNTGVDFNDLENGFTLLNNAAVAASTNKPPINLGAWVFTRKKITNGYSLQISFHNTASHENPRAFYRVHSGGGFWTGWQEFSTVPS